MNVSRRELLEEIAKRARDPNELSSDILEEMVKEKVGPFKYDWPKILAEINPVGYKCQ